MSSPNIQTYSYPADTDHNGDVIINYDHTFAPVDCAANKADLLYDHFEIAHIPEPFLDDPNPGPSTRIADRDPLLLETLDAASLAKKAQGRANNMNNRGYIGRNINRPASEVNDNGLALLPEHLKRAEKSFTKLMGYTALKEAGFDTTGMPTLNTFIGTYFGAPEASKRNKALRKQIANRSQ